MRNIELAYAENSRELYKQNWKKLPNQTLDPASKEGKDGADSVVDFRGKKVRYIYIHTLGNAGQGNWDGLLGSKDPKASEEKGRSTLDAATGMGGTAFDDRQFTIGLGHVRFYGKPLQLPKPELAIADCKLRLDVQGYTDAEIRYTLDGSIPLRMSPLYRSPVAIDSDVVIRARAFGGSLLPSEYVPIGISVGDVVCEGAARKSLTEEDLAGMKGAFVAVELYDSDIGPYLKQLQINGENVADVPISKKNKVDLNYIVIPESRLAEVGEENHIKFAGGAGDAYKLRNVTLYVQLENGSWVKSETDSAAYCSQSRRNWVRSSGTVMNPIEMEIQF